MKTLANVSAHRSETESTVQRSKRTSVCHSIRKGSSLPVPHMVTARWYKNGTVCGGCVHPSIASIFMKATVMDCSFDFDFVSAPRPSGLRSPILLSTVRVVSGVFFFLQKTFHVHIFYTYGHLDSFLGSAILGRSGFPPMRAEGTAYVSV